MPFCSLILLAGAADSIVCMLTVSVLSFTAMDQRPSHYEHTCTTSPVWNRPDLEGVDDLSAAAFRTFTRTLRLHARAIVGALGAGDIHHGQALCLRVLKANDGATQRDVAEMLHIAPPTLSRMLSAMEKAELVTRSQDEVDQRVTRVYLTTRGRRRERQAAAVVRDYVAATFATLSADERRQLIALMTKLGDSFAALADEADEPCCDGAEEQS